MAGDREQCLAAGMDDYLTKPVKVRESLGNFGAEKAIEAALQLEKNGSAGSLRAEGHCASLVDGYEALRRSLERLLSRAA